MNKRLTTPLTKEKVLSLKSGEIVFITGTIYTARDAAHKRMVEDFKNTGKFPFDIKDQIIYYAGPAPAKPGDVIGSAGPTTSGRMDLYAPVLLDNGETGMIGKGVRSKEVIDSMIKNKAVYFGATGGAGALIASNIKTAEVVAYEDLGAEAVFKLYVEDFPAVVIIDCHGNNMYEIARKSYKK